MFVIALVDSNDATIPGRRLRGSHGVFHQSATIGGQCPRICTALTSYTAADWLDGDAVNGGGAQGVLHGVRRWRRRSGSFTLYLAVTDELE